MTGDRLTQVLLDASIVVGSNSQDGGRGWVVGLETRVAGGCMIDETVANVYTRESKSN